MNAPSHESRLLALLLETDQGMRLTHHVPAIGQADAVRWYREGVTPSLSVNVTPWR